jgi:DNA-binding transcriptional LysR family regulator
MDLVDIEAFLATVDSGSLSKAAATLFASQSTISHRLRKLEEELGVALLLRRRGLRRVELTQKGEEFVPLARQWQTLWQTTESFKLTNPLISLSVAGPDSTNICLLPLYRRLSGEESPIRLRLRTLPSEEVYAAIGSREIDVGFVFKNLRYRDIVCRPIYREEIFLICKTGSPYGSEPIHPRDLDVRDEIFLPWSSEFQQWHDTWWNPGLNPHVWVDNVALLLDFMDTGQYWATCPRSVLLALRGRTAIECHEFSVPPPSRVCYLIEPRYPRQDKIAAVQEFRRQLEHHLTAHGFRQP